MPRLPIRQLNSKPLIVQVELPDPLYRVFTGAESPLVYRQVTPAQMNRATDALATIQARRGLLNFRNIVQISAAVIATRSALDEIGFQHAQLSLDETNRQKPVLVITIPTSR